MAFLDRVKCKVVKQEHTFIRSVLKVNGIIFLVLDSVNLKIWKSYRKYGIRNSIEYTEISNLKFYIFLWNHEDSQHSYCLWRHSLKKKVRILHFCLDLAPKNIAGKNL